MPPSGRTFLSDFLASFARVFHRRTAVPHSNTFPPPGYAGAESPRAVDQSKFNLLLCQSGKHESGSIATTICRRSTGHRSLPCVIPISVFPPRRLNIFGDCFWPINCDAIVSGEGHKVGRLLALLRTVCSVYLATSALSCSCLLIRCWAPCAS